MASAKCLGPSTSQQTEFLPTPSLHILSLDLLSVHLPSGKADNLTNSGGHNTFCHQLTNPVVPGVNSRSATMALCNQSVDFLSDSFSNHKTQLPILAVAGAAFTLGLLSRSLLSRNESPQTVLVSPRSTVLPGISESQNRQLPLPTDVLPGARDVASPYGSTRVYEWGPEDGPKVLMVHGITTPCIALGGLAHALVDRGCRVILFDLYVSQNNVFLNCS